MNTNRRYEFSREVPLFEAMRLITLALDDEGLVLVPRGAANDDVYSVLVGSTRVVVVPESRILARESETETRYAYGDK